MDRFTRNYRRKLDWFEAGQENGLQFKIAQLLEDLLSDPQGAIGVYGEILEDTPKDEEALKALARLYQSEAMWVELADILEQQVELEDEARSRADLQVRLGELREQRLGETEQGVDIYRSVLEDDPDHEGARAALERILDDVEFKAASADILVPIYQARDDWARLIEAYEIQVQTSDDEIARLELLHRIAVLHLERGAMPDKAFATYARAFRIFTRPCCHSRKPKRARYIIGDVERTG